MKEDVNNIFKIVRNLKIIAFVSIIATLVISFINIKLAYQNSTAQKKYIYTLSEHKNLMPLERIEKENYKETLVKGHIELFINNFYQYDQWNYRERIQKSLWLIDESGKDLYNFYKDEGHFNSIIQTTSSQKVSNINIKLNSTEFIFDCILSLNRTGQTEANRYKLTARGKYIEVSQNYPLNPMGYLIMDYKEVTKKKLEK